MGYPAGEAQAWAAPGTPPEGGNWPANELEQVLASMPLRVWRRDSVTPLSPHPNDPGA